VLGKYIRRSRTTPSSAGTAVPERRTIASDSSGACPVSASSLRNRCIGIARAIPIRSGISQTLPNSDRLVTMTIHGSKNVVSEIVDCLIMDVVFDF
jgi:hypothetical protein